MSPHVSKFGFACSASDRQLRHGEDHIGLTHAKHRAWPTAEEHSGGYSFTHLFNPPGSHRVPSTQPQLSGTQMLTGPTQRKSGIPHMLAQHGPRPRGVHLLLMPAAMVAAASPAGQDRPASGHQCTFELSPRDFSDLTGARWSAGRLSQPGRA